ncbi:MAG: ribbon-helix-helix domain-containing protein [Candidatus Methylumidiphilus sp.]
MNTATLHISLPESLNRFVQERVEKEHYVNPSDYIMTLIRDEQKRQEEQRLEAMLLEGLASGQGLTMGTPDWEAFWQKVQARVEASQSTEPT